MNVVIDEPYPEMFSTVEKKVFDKILAFVLITYPVTFCLQSFHSCFFFRTQKRTEPNHRTENVTYEYTVTPKSHGPTTVPRTHITYDDSNEAHIDADLRLLVESPEEYAKRTDRHIVCFLPHLNSHPQRDLTIEHCCFFCLLASGNRSTGSSTLLPPCWLRASRPSSSTRRTRRSSEPTTDGLVPRRAPHAIPAHHIPSLCQSPRTHIPPLRSDVCMTAATPVIKTV